MGIPLVEGRDFEERDLTGRLAIINESLARTYFPNHDAIGKHLTLDSWVLPSDRTREIIGVSGDVKHRGLDAGAVPLVYLPLAGADQGPRIQRRPQGLPAKADLGEVAPKPSACQAREPVEAIQLARSSVAATWPGRAGRDAPASICSGLTKCDLRAPLMHP
jgi:hypothetical protein